MKQLLSLVLISTGVFVAGFEATSFAEVAALQDRLRSHMVYAMPSAQSPQGVTTEGVAEPIARATVNGVNLILDSSTGHRVAVTYFSVDRARQARNQIDHGGSIDLSACVRLGAPVSVNNELETCTSTFYRLSIGNCQLSDETPIWFALDRRLFDVTQAVPGQFIVEKQVCRQSEPLPWNY